MRTQRRSSLIFLCVSFSLASFVVLDFWSKRNASLARRFERLWHDDIDLLQSSQKLPKNWSNMRKIRFIGGTPETKKLLAQISPPLQEDPQGKFELEVLLILWEENGVKGVTVQYNAEDIDTKNQSFEIGRTIVLDKSNLIEDIASSWRKFWKD